MVRIMGNSTERIPIKDLNDVIYYRQIKQYSDVEYNMSKDLKREKIKGNIVVLEQNDGIRGSEMDLLRERVSSSIISAQDFKDAIREILPGIVQPDMKGAVRDIAPLIVDVVRQELSKMTVNATSSTSAIADKSPAKFVGPEYIPTVSTEGFISNVEAKKSEVSSGATQDALAALRRLNK
jgi:hypothetical protein